MLFRSSKKLCFTGMLIFAARALSWGLSSADTKVFFIH